MILSWNNGVRCIFYHVLRHMTKVWVSRTCPCPFQWDLVCSRSWLLQVLSPVALAGLFVGSLFCGSVANRWATLQWRDTSVAASQIACNSTVCSIMRKAFPCHASAGVAFLIVLSSHLKIGHPWIKSTGARFSNEFQWPVLLRWWNPMSHHCMSIICRLYSCI